MTVGNVSIQEALNDLKAVRSAIERLEGPIHTAKEHTTMLMLQAGAAFLSGCLLIEELLTGNLTSELIYSIYDPIFRNLGLAMMAAMVLVLIVATYGVLAHGAKKSDEPLEVYVRRNFQSFTLLAFSSDLLCKLVAIALVILAKHPEWVSPLLILFTADYLFQSRLFNFSFGIALLIGLICVGIALIQMLSFDPTLVPALSTFTLLSVASALETLRKKSSMKSQGDIE